MKWVLGLLAVTACVCALGCARREVSSEGKIVQVAPCWSFDNPSPEALQRADDAIRAVPSKAPVMERFEWGRTEGGDPARTLVLFTAHSLPTAVQVSFERCLVDDADG